MTPSWRSSSFALTSTAPALFAGGWALDQLWLFWLAPIAGAAAGGFVYSWISSDRAHTEDVIGDVPVV